MDTFHIAEDVIVVAGRAMQSVATIVLSADGALLIDGLASEDDAGELDLFITRTLGTTVRQIVLTHYMSDHMAALQRYRDAPAIAHRYFEHTWLSQAPQSRRPDCFRRPDLAVDAHHCLAWGRHTLELFHNPGHTMSTLAVDIPLADAIVTADNTVGNIAYVSTGAPGLQLAAIERAIAAGRKTIIPGHIGPFDGKALHNARAYLVRLEELVSAARANYRGGDADSVILAIPPEACLPDGTLLCGFEREWHRQGLRKIVERGLFA